MSRIIEAFKNFMASFGPIMNKAKIFRQSQQIGKFDIARIVQGFPKQISLFSHCMSMVPYLEPENIQSFS